MATPGGGGKVWDSQASCSPWTSGKPLTTQPHFQLKRPRPLTHSSVSEDQMRSFATFTPGLVVNASHCAESVGRKERVANTYWNGPSKGPWPGLSSRPVT